jgi:hypothetical protein
MLGKKALVFFLFFCGGLKMRPLFHAGAQWQEEQVMNCMWIQF